MARHAAVLGGPADGEAWPWTTQAFRDVRFGDREYVYRRGREAWEFMGPDAHRCGACGAVVEVPRSFACPLCGADPANGELGELGNAMG